jgi:hypothetical protein
MVRESQERREQEDLPGRTGFFGGPVPARGWNAYDWEDQATLFREGFRPETPVHESFDSVEEVRDFVRGSGEYSDSNSFFYSEDDFEEQSQEGFFSDFHCPDCVDENLEADVGGMVDSRVFPEFRAYEVESFKLEEQKFRGEMWYQCDRHPGVYIMESRTWYE